MLFLKSFLEAIPIVSVATNISAIKDIIENSGADSVGVVDVVGELTVGVGELGKVVDTNWVAVTGGSDGFGVFKLGVKFTLPKLKSFF